MDDAVWFVVDASTLPRLPVGCVIYSCAGFYRADFGDGRYTASFRSLLKTVEAAWGLARVLAGARYVPDAEQGLMF